jgi:tetratricopeptide (TPR) repeat protein
MIFIGSRSTNRVMGQKVYTCSRCKKPSYHAIVRSRGWFTLYFIPLIPLGKSTISRCNLCGFQERINNEQADSWFLLDQANSTATPEKTSEQLMDEGSTHYEAGRYMEAIAAYDQVLHFVPNHAAAYYSKGNVLSSLGRYQEAILAYDRAIQLAPHIPDGYAVKGKALESIGRTTEAQESYEMARQVGYRR